MMAMGVNRYLVTSGYKQLISTQSSKPGMKDCWCPEELKGTIPGFW